MPRLWGVHRTFPRFFDTYHLHILTLSVLVATSIGYLHYELQHSGGQLSDWKTNALRFLNGPEGLIIALFLFLITSVMFAFLIGINLSLMRSYKEATHLQMKKRYVDYLFVGLISRIEQIERKHLRSQEIIDIECFMQAHEDLRKVVDRFRMDAKKLLALSEVEVLPPPELVFPDDEIRSSRFAQLSVSEDLIRELAAS